MNSGMLISKNALKGPRIYVAITWPLPERCRKSKGNASARRALAG